MTLATIDDIFLESYERAGKRLYLFIGLTKQMKHQP